MSYPTKNDLSPDSGVGEAPSTAEVTLRLIANLPAPEGLEDRVHVGLRSAPRSARVLAWPVRFPGSGEWMRAIAAAAIVFVVAGGGYGIYSHVSPGQPAQGVAGPRISAPGGFSEGGAVRRPQTLQGPVVVTHATATATPKPKAPIKPATAMPIKARSTAESKSPASPAAQAVP
jgi:hypothetical protein